MSDTRHRCTACDVLWNGDIPCWCCGGAGMTELTYVASRDAATDTRPPSERPTTRHLWLEAGRIWTRETRTPA